MIKKKRFSTRKETYYIRRPKNEELTPDNMTYADHLAKQWKKDFLKKSKNEP